MLPGAKLDGESLSSLFEQEGVTMSAGVPTVWLGFVDYMRRTGRTNGTFRRAIVGGAACPPHLAASLEEIGVKAVHAWGMTELSPLGTVSPASAQPRSARVSGRPPVGVDLRLVDYAGMALPDQRSGEGQLQVRGASVIDRYLGHDTPAGDAGGWFDTGDLATIDDDGNLTITGRSKDLIKSGGEWINPGEIEAIVGALPAVGLVAVLGRPHPKWTEGPVVVIEPRAGQSVSEEDVVHALEGKVPRWWMPDAVLSVARMPLAMTGKVDKRALRETCGF